MSAKSRIEWTPEMDAALIDVYRSRQRAKLKCLSLDWGIAPSTIHRRAVYTLGVTPFHRNGASTLWCDQEDALVVRFGHERPVDLQRRLREAGFRRGLKAIINHRGELKRRGCPVGAYRESLTTAEIAAGMGCSLNVVERWIKEGVLQATALTPNSLRAKHYQVKPSALRHFCLTHTQRLMRLNPDIIWYTDLIRGESKPARAARKISPAARRPDANVIEFPLHLEAAHG